VGDGGVPLYTGNLVELAGFGTGRMRLVGICQVEYLELSEAAPECRRVSV